MKEVKTPRKPLAIYYAIVLLMLLLLNLVLLPWMEERQIKEVDYGTFMTMTEEKNIGRVDIESNQIIFTDKDETQVYKTGLMNDTGLTERLYDAGATFSSEIVGTVLAGAELFDLVRPAHHPVLGHWQPDEQKADGKRPAAARAP